MTAAGKTVVRTGTTGLAAKNIGGMTIHKFSGIGDGSLSGGDCAAYMLQNMEATNAIRYSNFYFASDTDRPLLYPIRLIMYISRLYYGTLYEEPSLII